MVRKVGFEPTRLAAPPPQDGASASSATSAQGRVRRILAGSHFQGKRPKPSYPEATASRAAVASAFARAAAPVVPGASALAGRGSPAQESPAGVPVSASASRTAGAQNSLSATSAPAV